MDYVEEFEHKGCRIRIAQDIDPMSPDDWEEDLVFFVSFDNQFPRCPEGSPVRGELELQELLLGPDKEYYEDCPEELAEAVAEWKKERAEWAIYEVSVYSHGIISLTFAGDPDVDTIKAAIFVKKDGEWGPDVNFKAIARDHCKTWNQYFGGEVYGYMIDGPLETKQDLCEKCGHVQREYEEREVLESVWGFYGLEYCIEEAKGVVDYHVENAAPKV